MLQPALVELSRKMDEFPVLKKLLSELELALDGKDFIVEVSVINSLVYLSLKVLSIFQFCPIICNISLNCFQEMLTVADVCLWGTLFPVFTDENLCNRVLTDQPNIKRWWRKLNDRQEWKVRIISFYQ